MNGGEQDSGKSVSHFKLSATVPEFVPKIARIKVTSSGDLVINSNLSPLVPEFHPSVSPGSSPPRSVHGLQQPSKQPCVNLHQANQTSFRPSMKNILVKAESSGSEKRKDGNCEGHAVVASGTDESSTGNSVKVKKKKKQRKKNESSGLITKQENTGVPVSCDTITGDQLHSDASLNDDNSARSKAKEVSSSTQQNDLLLLSHHENSSANTDSTVTANFGCCNTVNQPSSFKEPYAVSTLTVSYSDKVKSSSPKGNSTSNHLGAEKTRTNHFTSESFKRKDKPVDLKKRSEFCHSQSPGTVSSNNDGKKPVKSGQKSDDSSWKTVCRDNDDNKLKDSDSSRSQSTDAKHNQRTGKQMRRNGSFKKTTCDDDDNWRVRKDVDPTSVSRKKEINKSNIKDSDTGSLEKRTCYQEEKIIDLISNGCQDLKHENVVGHKVVDKKGIASKKLQNFHSIDSSGTEFTQSSSFLISKARSDVSEDIQERGIKPIRMSTIPDADSNLVMAEFPEFKESVKVKRLSITAGGTMDHKDEVTSPKATAPLSYSAVLRSPPQLKVMHAWENESASKTCGGRLKVPPPQTTMTEVENESNQEESNEKKKKKKKKKKKTGETKEQTRESGSTRRTQKPIQFDLGVMLQTITKSSSDKPQQSNKKLVISTGVLPSQLSVTVSPDMKPVKAFPQLKGENKSIPHNTLDSTAPVVKRGKERETPARKKPSALKKIILKEREEKKKAKKTTETGDADKTSDEKENITFEAEAKVTVQEIQNTLEDDAVTQVDSKPSSPTHQEIAAEIHSRRFREYCFQVPDKEVDGVATDLLRELVRFQDRQFHKDPVKAKAKRRFVLGLREVHKHLKLRRLKCVIISSNVERIQSSGGLDDTLGSIINLCRENNVPVVFALKRQMLGRVLLKKVPVSIVGIFNYDGAQDHFKKLIELTQKTKQAYTDRWEETREKLELQQQETSGVKTAEMDMVPNAGLQQAGVQHTTKEAAESTDDEESDANKENDSDSERDVFIENELEIQDL